MTRALLRALLLTLALPLCAAAQRVRVDARVSPTTGRVGDVVILDVTVVTSGPAPDMIETPALPPGLRLTGSNDFTEYQFRLPGGRQRTTRRELMLAAVGPGHFVIPPLLVRVDGASYRTRPVRIDVAAAYAGSPAGGAPASGPGDEVLLQAWATPDTAWVGEQVTVRADALFSTDVRARLAGAPQYEGAGAPGFWAYDLASNDGAQYRPVRGRTYEVQTFRRAFFPLSAGRYYIPGSRLSYAVRRGFLSGPESYDLRSDSMPIVVRPLPALGRPAGFAGAVGHYTATARVEPATVGVGETATLMLEVRGDGNIKAVPPPHLPALPGVQVFAPVEDSDVRVDAEQVGGVKRFSWVLIPSRPGKLAIAPLELDYFDPTRGRYDVSRTEALGLRVDEAVAGSTRRGPGAGAASVAALLRPLRERDDGAGAVAWVHSRALGAVATLPVALLLGLGLEGVVRRRRGAQRSTRAKAGSAMLERVRERAAQLRARVASASPAGAAGAIAGTVSSDAGELEAELLEFVGEWLAERLGVQELAGMPAARLDAALRAAGVRPVVASGLTSLVRQLEEARYRPEPPTSAQRLEWVDEAERLLAEVHAGARRRRSAAGALLACVLAGTCALALAGPARAAPAEARAGAAGSVGAARPDSGFAAGVVAFRASRFAQAADLFADYAVAHPTHAAAWYDLGNAAFRAGQHGRAIWGWLRAVKLRPRDADVRQNLALAGVDPEVVDAATPPVALSPDELLGVAAAAWLLMGVFFLAWRVTRRRSLVAGGVFALVLALALAGSAAWMARGAARAIVLDGAPLLGAPNEHADSLGQVVEGAAVQVVERQDGWVRVRTASSGAPGAAPAGSPTPDGVGRGPEEGWIEEGRLGVL